MLFLNLADRVQAGYYVKEQILSSFVRLIATTPDLQTYSVQKLYAALRDDISQEALNLAGAWVIGEYGDSLLRGGQYEEEELVKEVKESDVVDLFTAILNSSHSGLIVTEFIITAAMKLTTRLADPAQVERLRRLLETHQANLDIEIQQRAVEYGGLFGYDQVRKGVLERMPPPEIREEQRVLGEATPKKKNARPAPRKKIAPVTEQDMLLDLMGDGPSTAANGSLNGTQHNNADLLADILGGDAPATQQTNTSAPLPRNNMSSIMDLFDNGSQQSAAPASSSSAANDLFSGMGGAAPAAQAAPAAHSVYNENDLVISFLVNRSAAAVQVVAKFKNNSAFESLKDVNLQAAVPKSQKLQLQSISNSDLAANAEATQQMRVTSVQGVSQVAVY